MQVRLYNTMGRELQTFVPLEQGKVKLYCCGLTVYNYAHIGNLRSYLFEDILRRVLERNGFEVAHVMNVTDVGHLTDDGDEGEDKMIVGARASGMSVWEIAEFFTKAFLEDMRKLNLRQPSIICKATDHIPEMQELIGRLEERGLAYQAGGNVYYSTDQFPAYGKLALLDRQELQAGARVAVDEGKRNPRDFVLWFTRGKFEQQAMQWDSPWGRGYPGWHIECSAMSMKYLGDQIDIHCGGVDHISVHHTNEIAQSEGATGKPWVNYWLHGEFLLMNSGRMGKSQGNMITLATLEEEGYDPLDYRYFLLGAHYRTQLAFSTQALDGARAARKSLVEQLRHRFDSLSPADQSRLEDQVDAAGSSERVPGLSERGTELLVAINEAFADDLNAARALGLLRAAVKDREMSDLEACLLALDSDQVFGLRLWESLRTKDVRTPPGNLEALIEERRSARAKRDFARADEIRDELRALGIVLTDGASGTTWDWE